MDLELKNLDSYSIKARIYPAFIVLSPLIILIVFSNYENIKVIQIILAFLTTFGFAFLLEQLARDNGERKEDNLFKKWDGKPSIQILRLNNDNLDNKTLKRYRLDEITRKRYFDKLVEIMKIEMPSKDYEKEHMEEADKKYDACSQFLISKTRDKEKFYLLHVENINYGFRRNLWGLKYYALIILFICFIVHIIQKYETIKTNLLLIFNSEIFIPILIYFFLLLTWLFIIRPNWIKDTGFEFARRLYETLDIL